MTQTLFEILTDEELTRLKSVGQTRNVRIKDLTLGEVEELINVFWPGEKRVSVMDVMKQLKARRVLS